MFHNSAELTERFEARPLSWSPPVVDVTSVRFLLAALSGWLNNQQAEAMAYVIEENRTLRAQLGGRRLRLTDD